MGGFKDVEVEKSVLDALDRQPAGAPLHGDDREIAAGWLDRLRHAGLEPRAEEAILYTSVPERGELIAGGLVLECEPVPFSRSTAGERVEGHVARVDPEADTALGGAVAVLDAALEPETVYRVERRGAVAQVYVTREPARSGVSSTTVWGAPTHETIGLRPRTPVVRTPYAAAQSAGAMQEGARVSVSTWLREGWSPHVVPVVEIHGTPDVDEFVLVHGGDADALLAMARALHARRSDLRRSVRVAWWPARAISAHGASAWYADAFAGALDEWCAAHLDVAAATDAGPGVVWMSEGAEACLEAIADAGAETVTGRRPGRAGDYSFTQIGISGIFGGRRFARDAHAYLLVVTRFVTAPLYPLDYTAPVLEMGAAVQRYQGAAGNEVDLRGVSQDLGTLRRAISAWRSDVSTAIARHPSDHELRRRANATLRRLARVLVPLGYARGERFDHDPAVRYSALPRLEAALHVASAGEAMKPFVRTAIAREQNRIRAAIRDARRLVT